ncbi:hypothetical protein TWF730_009757 [Orbilia blumenaviensis]|uniref:Uncharacterized protein n=1 Tax=Orbilia blumenaviensis TaxID=1796055 RepID=A0AAV9UWV5_9PEZI
MKIAKRKTDLQRDDISEWLSPLQSGAKHMDTRKKLIPDTGKSLLEQFHKWRSNQESFLLFALGAPGAGKTQAMSVLIDYLLQASQESPKIGVAYLYMDLNDRISQTTENIIGAIIKQLLRSIPEIPRSIEAVWRSRQDGTSMDARLEMLYDACKDFDEIFVCMDALDEHVNPAELLKHLKPSEGTRFRLICTGREHIQSIITTIIEEATVQTFRIKARESDIKAFIKQEIDDARRLGDMPIDDNLEKEMIEKLLQLSDGVFLIPVLHIKLVLGESANLGERTITDCRSNLNALQSGLSPAIDKMMQRIENKALAANILAWIWLAVRPLTVDELLHALAVRAGDNTLNKESLYRPKTFLRCCFGMVTIDAETKTVRLFHSSLKDYFAEHGSALGQTLHECHRDIARICLTYIQFRPFCEKISDQTKQQSVLGEAQISSAYPLLEYASCNWGHHFRASEQDDKTLVELARKFLFRDPQERHWSHLKLCQHLLKQYPGSSEESFLISFSEWHTISYFGAHSLLLGQGPSNESLDSKDSKFGRSPIVWAALEGHGKVVQELLQWGVDPNSADYQKRTALFHAAANGHMEVLNILIENDEIDINAQDIGGGTALHWAALKGREDITSTLLDNGANVHMEDVYGGTPLAWSIEAFAPGVTRLLLAHSAEFEYYYGPIADKIEIIFGFAAGNDFQVEYLPELRDMVEKKYIGDGLLTNSLDYLRKCFTRLFSYNYQTKIKLEGLDAAKAAEFFGLATNFTLVCCCMDIAEDQKVTPLSRALAINNVAAAEILLEKVTSVDTRDTNGRTALSYAAGGGLIKIVKLLLEGGADPNCRDVTGRTPLSYAVGDDDLNLLKNLIEWQPKKNTSEDRQRMEQLVKLLLGKGVNPNTLDKTNRSLLSRAAENCNAVAVRLLLQEKNVDPDSSDSSGRTPLSYAARKGGKEVVELLLRKANVKPDSHNSKGRTPLSYAAEYGADNVVKLLLEKNVNLESEDVQYKTPLFYATEVGHLGIVKLLVERGADPGKKDKEGITPLSNAIIAGHNAIANLMLPKCDLDTGIVDKNGWTLLFHAAKTGALMVAEMLLQENANPNSVDKDGIVPLILAARNGHDDMVRLLLKNGAIADSKHNEGMTPLFWSVSYGHTKVTKTLLENGANPNTPGRHGAELLCIAILMGRITEAEILIDHGADFSGRGSHLPAPLFASAYVGSESITKLLLDRGADPNVQITDGRTPLFAAMNGHHKNVVKMLLNAGADPYHKTNYGATPISYAIQLRDIDILNVIFRNGADPMIWAVQTGCLNVEEAYLNSLDSTEDQTTYTTARVENVTGRILLWPPGKATATDLKGRTALSHAAGVGCERVTNILAKSGSRDIQDNMGRTPIFYGIDSGEKSVVNALLEAGSDINHKDHSSLTPLLYSTVTGKDKMVRVLLEKGADASQKNDRGKIALEVAVDKGFRGICQLLLARSGGSYDCDGFHLCQKCVLDNVPRHQDDQGLMNGKYIEQEATFGGYIGGFMATGDVGGRKFKRQTQELEDRHVKDDRPPKIQRYLPNIPNPASA